MRGDLTRIEDLLDRVLERIGVARPVDVVYLVENWARVAGEPWATRSRPVHLEDGELIVEAADGSAASLLRYQAAGLVNRLDEALGQGLVTSVRVRMGRPRPPFSS